MACCFSDQLSDNILQTSPIILGIDPNFNLMPHALVPKTNSAKAIQHALTQFSELLIEASEGLIPAIKFQSAYYEQFGVAGITALSNSLSLSKSAKLQTILDIKRADIGSTALAYAQAYLSEATPIDDSLTYDSGLSADCITINPFLGEDSLEPFIQLATQNKKGLFILVNTSNPGASMIQTCRDSSDLVYEKCAKLVHKYGQSCIGKHGYSCIGAVVGATSQHIEKLRELMPQALLLMPGVGAQGAEIKDILPYFDKKGLGITIPISRGITYPKDQSLSIKDYKKVVRETIQSLISDF